jgi:hypothetical protein
MLFILLSTMLLSLGGCILPPPWPDERHEHHDRDRRGHDRDGEYEHDRGGRHDHDQGHYERR